MYMQYLRHINLDTFTPKFSQLFLSLKFITVIYQRVSIASYANRWYIARGGMSVCLSVCHTPVLYQNEES